MPFPEFEKEKRKVLFFSRGRGRGHAIPDIEIIRELCAFRPDAEVRIVSYGTGAATFHELGFHLIDVGLPETSPIAEMSVIAGKLTGWLNPDLVVAHEEFPAMPAAKIFSKPSLFITDWFAEPDSYAMGALRFADEVLFLGRPGVFAEPSWLRDKVRYIGPVLRNFSYGPEDRLRARAELDIPEGAFVVSVFPGSWLEAETPLLDLVTAAFDNLECTPKKLIWLGGQDSVLVQSRLAGRDALVFDRYWEIDRLMVASDVAITKMNRMTIFELHHLCVPTLALSWDLNPIDDRAVEGVTGIPGLAAAGLDALALTQAIRNASAARKPWQAWDPRQNAVMCAGVISAALK